MKYLTMMGLILLAALHFASPQPVLACTPTPQGLPPYTLEDQVNASPIILEGTVTADSTGDYNSTATVSVQQYLKGDGPSEVMISNFGSSSMCLTDVAVGDHLIFFASGDPTTGLRAFYMSAGAAIQGASEENIAAINAVLAPEAQQEPSAMRLPATVHKVLSGLAFILWAITR